MIERTRDYALIRSIMTHPRIYDWIADDMSAPVYGFHPPEDDRLIYLLASDAQKALGVILFAPESGVEVRAHHYFLPTAWGKKALGAALESIEWLWANTGYVRIIGKTPEYNTLALKFARKCGFSYFGTDSNSIMKNGRLWNQYYFGLSRKMEA